MSNPQYGQDQYYYDQQQQQGGGYNYNQGYAQQGYDQSGGYDQSAGYDQTAGYDMDQFPQQA